MESFLLAMLSKEKRRARQSPDRKSGLRILHNEHLLLPSIGNRFFDTVIDFWIPRFDVQIDLSSNIDKMFETLRKGRKKQSNTATIANKDTNFVIE